MFLLSIVCLSAIAAAVPIDGPVLYDQRQDGDTNGQVEVSNVLFLFAIPRQITNDVIEFIQNFSKSNKRTNNDHEIQDRADERVMEAFVEPSKPYKVEIGSDEKSGKSEERAEEVVIAGRRRLGTDMPDAEQDDLKLLGATENCGPDRVRDPVTLMCKDIQPVKTEPEVQKETDKKVEPLPAPEVIPS